MSLVDNVEKVKQKESFKKQNLAVSKSTKKECVKPTVDNPFMNVLLTDYKEGSKRNNKDACDIDNKNIRKSMKEKYDMKKIKIFIKIYYYTLSCFVPYCRDF